MATADTDQQLAWEARQRPRAGIAAILAAVLTLASDLWTSAALRDAPKGGYLESLQRAIEPGRLGGAESLRTPYFQFVDDHSTTLVAANVIKALGFVGVAWALTFLIAATRARRPEVARPVLYVALVGAVLSAIAGIGFWAGYSSAVSDFLAGPHTVDRAADAGGGSLLVTAQFVGLAGQLALAAGYVFVALNAMRAGLLTRFMGILGCIIGVLTIIPLGPLPVVQTFWLLAVGALMLGFWPSGMPPAWKSGRAEPWPSQAQVAQQRREAMDARRAAKRGEPAPASAPAEPPASPAGPVPARAKRKRKRR